MFFCPSGKLKKFENGAWHVVPPEDQVKMTKLDGQVWLALLNLLLSPECQRKYHFDGFNKSQLLKVGPYITKAMAPAAQSRTLPALGTSGHLSPSSLWAPRSQWWESSGVCHQACSNKACVCECTLWDPHESLCQCPTDPCSCSAASPALAPLS